MMFRFTNSARDTNYRNQFDRDRYEDEPDTHDPYDPRDPRDADPFDYDPYNEERDRLDDPSDDEFNINAFDIEDPDPRNIEPDFAFTDELGAMHETTEHSQEDEFDDDTDDDDPSDFDEFDEVNQRTETTEFEEVNEHDEIDQSNEIDRREPYLWNIWPQLDMDNTDDELEIERPIEWTNLHDAEIEREQFTAQELIDFDNFLDAQELPTLQEAIEAEAPADFVYSLAEPQPLDVAESMIEMDDILDDVFADLMPADDLGDPLFAYFDSNDGLDFI